MPRDVTMGKGLSKVSIQFLRDSEGDSGWCFWYYT